MKRLLPESDDDGEPRKRPTLLSVGRDELGLRLMQRLMVPAFEPVIRRVVREELQRVLGRGNPPISRPSVSLIQAPRATGQLTLNSILPDTLYTSTKIPPIEVIIHSGYSERLTTGPLSSLKVEILPLDGDFGGDDQENWTEEGFDDFVVRQREGKRPLLTGDIVITLRDGVGTFNNIMFTDNSCWIRSRKFRLGVRVVQSSDSDNRIRGAWSEPFVVKDRRGELYKKHDHPSLKDKIWRLTNIGKDGVYHKKLNEKGVETVEQFLQLLVTDEARLRSILGMSNKLWNETTNHARKCILDLKSYIYFSPGKEMGILLNCIFEVEKVTRDGGQTFQSLDNLTPMEKNIVEKLKMEAYRNQKDIVESGVTPSFDPSTSVAELPGTSTYLQDSFALVNFMGASNPTESPLKDIISIQESHQCQEHDLMRSNFNHMYLVDQGNQLALENTVSPQDLQLSQPLEQSQPFDPIHFNTVNLNNFIDVSSVQDNSFGNLYEDHLSSWLGNVFSLSSNENGGQSSPYPRPSSDLSSVPAGLVKPKGWCKLAATLKWAVLVRREVAAKRMAEFCA